MFSNNFSDPKNILDLSDHRDFAIESSLGLNQLKKEAMEIVSVIREEERNKKKGVIGLINDLSKYIKDISEAPSQIQLWMIINTILVDIHNKYKKALKIENRIVDLKNKISLYLTGNYMEVAFGDQKLDSGNIMYFTEQSQLSKLTQFYFNQHIKNGGKKWPKFNERCLVVADDGAGLFIDTEGTLLDDEKDLERIQAISKNVTSNLISAVLYCLAQNASVDSVPGTIRIGTAVNHNQRHWTGLMSTMTGFRAIYKFCLEKIKGNEYNELILLQKNPQVTTDSLLNGKLVLLLAKSLFDVNDFKHDDLVKFINEFINEGDIKLTFDHYDSLNQGHYHNRVKKSLSPFINNNVEFKINKCSQQEMNACGDHTICNLISNGLYLKTPSINERSSVLSSNLRAMTNHVQTYELTTSKDNELREDKILINCTEQGLAYSICTHSNFDDSTIHKAIIPWDKLEGFPRDVKEILEHEYRYLDKIISIAKENRHVKNDYVIGHEKTINAQNIYKQVMPLPKNKVVPKENLEQNPTQEENIISLIKGFNTFGLLKAPSNKNPSSTNPEMLNFYKLIDTLYKRLHELDPALTVKLSNGIINGHNQEALIKLLPNKHSKSSNQEIRTITKMLFVLATPLSQEDDKLLQKSVLSQLGLQNTPLDLIKNSTRTILSQCLKLKNTKAIKIDNKSIHTLKN